MYDVIQPHGRCTGISATVYRTSSEFRVLLLIPVRTNRFVRIQSTEYIVLLLVLLMPTVLWYMYESVPVPVLAD